MTNETLYFYRWDQIVPCHILSDPYDSEHPDYAKVKMADGGTTGVRKAELYRSKKGLLQVIKSQSEKQVRDYMKEIQSPESLIIFCLNHNVSGDAESGDPEAREAAIRRATEFHIISGKDDLRL